MKIRLVCVIVLLPKRETVNVINGTLGNLNAHSTGNPVDFHVIKSEEPLGGGYTPDVTPHWKRADASPCYTFLSHYRLFLNRYLLLLFVSHSVSVKCNFLPLYDFLCTTFSHLHRSLQEHFSPRFLPMLYHTRKFCYVFFRHALRTFFTSNAPRSIN